MKETYKTIKDYPNYKVSNFGNVKSIDRKVFYKHAEINYKSKILKQGKTIKNTYITFWVRLQNNLGWRKHYVHRLVANTFVANPLKKKEVNHIDSDSSNNLFTNLEWVTRAENMSHAKKYGNIRKGETSGMSKLKNLEVIDILTKQKTYKDYAKQYKISPRTIHNIWASKAWEHLTKKI